MTDKAVLWTPTAENERLPLLDVLRGVAILGILLVNIGMFSGPSREPGYVAVSGTTADVVVDTAVLFFVNGKSYLLFAFLFGLGFALQIERSSVRGSPISLPYLRRLALLFVIGMLHLVLLWEGDILAMYAVLGIGLVLIRKWSSRALLVAAMVLLMVSPVAEWLFYQHTSHVWGVGSPQASATETTPAQQAAAVYGHGRYLDLVAYRVERLPDYGARIWSNQGAGAFAGFLLGLYAGRRRFLQSISGQAARWRARMPWLVGAALATNLIYIVAFKQDHVRLEVLFLTIGGPLLCFLYVVGLGLLVNEPRWRSRLAPITAVGRLSLTNYLLQSVVCTTLFYGYGFGLYGHLSVVANFLIALGVFGLQILASIWWLKYFRFGPLEWLWRSFTYGRWQPLPKAAANR